MGKWHSRTCNEFYELIKQRVRKPNRRHKLKIVSDGNDQNIESIKNNFNDFCVEYSQVLKIREDQKVIAVETRNVYGNMPEEKITMRQIDSYCGTLRERIPIYVRETKAFSKRRQNVENRLDIFQVYRNFLWKINGKTPAMKEGIVNRVFTWENIFSRRL